MTAAEKPELVRLHGILDDYRSKSDVDCLVRAVREMLKDPRFVAFLRKEKNVPIPKKEEDLNSLVFIYLKMWLMRRDYEAAGTLCWDTETFTSEPRFVKLIWDGLTRHRLINVLGCASGGKCLGPEVPVMMFDGTIKLARDVKEGDVLMGDDSTPRNVLQKSVGFGPMYRVTPERSEPWTCNDAHILSLRCNQTLICGGSKKPSMKRFRGAIEDVSVAEYLNWSKRKKSMFKAFHVGVEFQKKELPFDPYIYGSWIGYGGTDVPALHTPDGPMARRWCEYFSSIGFKITVGYLDKCPMWCARVSINKGGGGQPNPFTDFIRTSVSNKEKFIRQDYLSNSRVNRLALLAGLIDSDGSVKGTGFEFVSKFERLARQVHWLARSLGFAATVRSRLNRISSIGFVGKYWRVIISGHGITEIPTLEKRPAESKSCKIMTNTGFTVEPIGDGEYHGFVIDGNHRFLLGDFTVTHNTYSASAWLLLDWCLDPEWTLVRVMSTKEDHVKKNLFGDMQRLFANSVIKLPGKADTESIAVESAKKGGQGIFVLVIPQGDAARGSIKGSKVKPRPEHPLFGRSSRTRLLIDEAQDVPPGAFEEIPNLLSSIEDEDVEHTKVLMSANPKDEFSRYGQNCVPVQGYETIRTRDSDVETWTSTTGWHCVRLNAIKSENMVANRVIFPRFFSPSGYRLKLRAYGGDVDHPLMWAEVYGMFPPHGHMTSIIQRHWIDRNYGEWLFEGPTIAVAACDVAFGGDQPAMSTGRVGLTKAWMDYAGNRHDLDEPRFALQADVTGILGRGDTQDLTDENLSRCKSLNVKPSGFGIDRTGVGQGTHDNCRRQWREKVDGMDPKTPAGQEVVDIVGINYAESATELQVCEEDTQKPKDLYFGIRSELWFVTGKFFEYDWIKLGRGVDMATIEELVQRRGGSPAGKNKLLQVEAKSEYKARGFTSPDRADSFTMMVQVARMSEPRMLPKAPDTTIAVERQPSIFDKDSGFGLKMGEAINMGFSLEYNGPDVMKD